MYTCMTMRRKVDLEALGVGSERSLQSAPLLEDRQKHLTLVHLGNRWIPLRYPLVLMEKVVYLSLGLISASVGSLAAFSTARHWTPDSRTAATLSSTVCILYLRDCFRVLLRRFGRLLRSVSLFTGRPLTLSNEETWDGERMRLPKDESHAL